MGLWWSEIDPKNIFQSFFNPKKKSQIPMGFSLLRAINFIFQFGIDLGLKKKFGIDLGSEKLLKDWNGIEMGFLVLD